MRYKVTIFPMDPNPYQENLYSTFDSTSMGYAYLTSSTPSRTVNQTILPFKILFYRIAGCKLFHLHWTYEFTFPGNNILTKIASTIYYYFMLTYIRSLGYKIVWTVHNILPHSPTFLNDIAARKYLAWIASAKIVHSPSTITEMQKLGLNTDNCHVIPHGNFIYAYPNTISPESARKQLNISKNEFVYLFFGRVERYKGVVELVKSFTSISGKNTKLLIVGSCRDEDLRTEIKEHMSDSVVWIDKHIPDADVQIYFNACDIVVYPALKITTSGSLVLAFSFGRAAIYPNIGNLTDLPEGLGITYKPGSPGLNGALTAAQNTNLCDLNQNAYNYALSLDWKMIGDQTSQLYKRLMA